MAEDAASRRLAVILHADVVGSTALVQRDEAIAHARMVAAFRRLAGLVTAYGGLVHEIRGDALVAEFPRASDALASSVAFQRANARDNEGLSDGIVPTMRIGLSLGEVIVADGTVTGPGVVMAQRLEQQAEPGGVCVGAAIREAAPSRLPFDYTALGTHWLKGFDEPVPVWSVALTPGAPLLPPETAATSRRTRRWTAPAHRWWAAGIGVAAALGASTLWLLDSRPTLTPPPAQSSRSGSSHSAKPSIAVLPFENRGGELDEEYFADGLTDDLITDLSKLSGLLVVGRHSSFTFKGQAAPIDTVARALGVGYVVQGSVRRAAGRVRVNAQLSDSSTGRHIWAERYDRDLGDLFTAQDEIVAEIVAALSVRLTRSERTKLSRRSAPEFEAYDLYLKARSGHLSLDQGRMRASLGLYEQAWTADPGFARAYAGYARLAADIWRLGSVRESLGTGALGREAAETAARKALDLDPSLADPHAVLALISMVDGRYEGAIRSGERAV